MENNKKNNVYFCWGLTAFLVIISSILFFFIINNFSEISDGVKSFIAILTPLIDGLIIAYVLTPIVDWFEINVFNRFLLKNKQEKFNNLNNNENKKNNVSSEKSKVGQALNDIKTKKKEKKKKNTPEKQIRVLSILVTLLIVSTLMYAFFANVIPELSVSINAIIKNYPTYEENLSNWAESFLFKYPELKALFNDQYFEFSGSINNILTNTILPKISDGMMWLTSGVFSAVRAIINFIIGIILSFYLLYNKELFLGQLKKIIYALLKRDDANNLIHNMRFTNKTFQGFLVGKCIDSLIIGLICFIILTILNTPYTVLVSVIVGVTNIIPLFGPFIGAIPSALLILMVDPKQAFYFIIVIIILQQFDGNILGPKILGSSTGLSGFWVVIAITVFGGLFGLIGWVIGVPLFAIIYTAVKAFINNKLKDKNLTTESMTYFNVDFIDEDFMYIKIPKKDVTSLATNKSPVHVNNKSEIMSANVSGSINKDNYDQITNNSPFDTNSDSEINSYNDNENSSDINNNSDTIDNNNTNKPEKSVNNSNNNTKKTNKKSKNHK